jgi:hypothetical protein
VLQLTDLHRTVLAGAYFETEVQIPTLLPEPYHLVKLPPLRRSELMEERVWDEKGRPLGIQIRVPDLFVRANNLLSNYLTQNEDYNYRYEIAKMVEASGRLLASVLKGGMIKVRERPGFMAHVQTRKNLPPRQIAVTEGFAKQILKGVYKEHPELFAAYPDAAQLFAQGLGALSETEKHRYLQLVWELLDGMPCWCIRFPLANASGIQAMTLRIVPGNGKVIWANPWNLEKLWLGDEDGDCAFAFLRVKEVLSGELEVLKLEPLQEYDTWTETHSVMSLGSLLHPEKLIAAGVKEKTVQDKFMPPALSSTHLRKEAIHNADTRQHVAVYTMAIGWWCSRVLGLEGGLPMKRAYELSYGLLEWYMENCMDARKGAGNSQFASNHTWDPYAHMETLLQGGELDWEGLEQIGIPPDSLEVLKTAWRLAEGNLRSFCAKSPVYWALVLKRKSMEKSVLAMLDAMMQLEIPPERVYDAMLADLTGAAVTQWPVSQSDDLADIADFSELYQY